MNSKDIWYGVLEAGEKSSPVVRDATLDASQGKVYLFNYARNQFIEYALAIVEPKLRDLTDNDIPQAELDSAYQQALQVFSSSHKIKNWNDAKPAPQRASQDDDDEIDFDMSDDDDMEEFIDDD